MYNEKIINALTEFIKKNDGIADKKKLTVQVEKEFGLTKARSVYYCKDFAIRFSQAEQKRMSNTVLSLSNLQKFDDKPFVVCVVSSKVNYLMLANTTFLKRISHSSKELRVDNIKGSFNGSDIMMEFKTKDEVLQNEPASFEKLFACHSERSFRENLERLVECTNDIVGREQKFKITGRNKPVILQSIERTVSFFESACCRELKKDLDHRTEKVKDEIVMAAHIDNVNIRGRIIEYLITEEDPSQKKQMMDVLKDKKPIPRFITEDKLSDYSRVFPAYITATDIKSKVLWLDGNPKAYNIDKLLEFLANEKSVYLIYIVGVKADGTIISCLCSPFDTRLLKTTKVNHHWSGRNSRGEAQFIGTALTSMLASPDEIKIDKRSAEEFLLKLMNKQ